MPQLNEKSCPEIGHVNKPLHRHLLAKLSATVTRDCTGLAHLGRQDGKGK